MPDLGSCSSADLSAAAFRFVEWLDRVGYESYDPYDAWGTKYGLWSRELYYRHGNIAAPLIAPLVLLDLVCPSARRLFVKKQRFATADAQLLLAFLNLYRVTGERKHLDRAIKLGDEILAYAVPGYRGPCWGYPFDWQNGRGPTWKRNTPYITCTPYCYEAYLELHELTGDARYHEIMAGIAEFVHKDLRDTPTSSTASAGSYSPNDNSQVVNASAYRAWLLLDAGRRFGRTDYTETGTRNLNFVLESQRDDGSWLYAMGLRSSFIDNFHTCFNLKNLIKINRALGRADIDASVRRGFEYYRQNLFLPNGDPKSFAVEPRFQVQVLEMYNFAEGMTLAALLADAIPGARDLGERLASRLIRDFQLRGGFFVTRVFRGGFRHTFPFIRWPQAQLFYGVTNMLQTSTATPARKSAPVVALATN